MIGYRRVLDGGLSWRENQGGILTLSPPGKFNFVTVASAKRVLRRERKFFIRWETGFDSKVESSWWHVIKDSYETIEELPKKTRYMIRKASKRYEARPVELSEILEQGYAVYSAAFERYDTHEPKLSRERFFESVCKLPEETEWWGVFERETERMVGFSENYVEDSTCFLVTMWMDPGSMKGFAGYLILHQMECHYLQDRGFRYISDGTRSLSHETNIHEFLVQKFNFRKAYALLHVVYVPWLGVLVSVAYPFREFISKYNIFPFKKATILLNQEAIRRECYQ